MDGGEILILGKLMLTFGILLAWPIWDLISLERKRHAAGRPRSTWPAPPPAPVRPPSATGPKDD